MLLLRLLVERLAIFYPIQQTLGPVDPRTEVLAKFGVSRDPAALNFLCEFGFIQSAAHFIESSRV
jgi:hypothetical protein